MNFTHKENATSNMDEFYVHAQSLFNVRTDKTMFLRIKERECAGQNLTPEIQHEEQYRKMPKKKQKRINTQEIIAGLIDRSIHQTQQVLDEELIDNLYNNRFVEPTPKVAIESHKQTVLQLSKQRSARHEQFSHPSCSISPTQNTQNYESLRVESPKFNEKQSQSVVVPKFTPLLQSPKSQLENNVKVEGHQIKISIAQKIKEKKVRPLTIAVDINFQIHSRCTRQDLMLVTPISRHLPTFTQVTPRSRLASGYSNVK